MSRPFGEWPARGADVFLVPGSVSNTDMFRKLQGFVAEFRRVLFAGLLTG
jgi:hypothetical protein